jgi:hypothetical protein
MRPVMFLVPAALIGVVLLTPTPARAGIDACGDVFVEAGAECEVVPPGADCRTRCTPVSVEAACAGELYLDCESDCTVDADVDCTASCQGPCEVDCDVDPGRFDCRAQCQSDCDVSCEASCSSDDSQCQASCRATCSGRCDARCDVELPEADCVAQCEACCTGFCEADASIDCQVDCQADGFVDCSVDVQGGCETACDLDEGALFCDGQFIDHGDNLDDCVEALQDLLDIEVDGYVRGECRGNRCEVEAGGTFSCGVGASDGGGAAAGWLLIGLAALAGTGRARRRSRQGSAQ